MKVLVVEDQVIIRMNTVRVLRSEGFEVLETGTGEDAIDLLSAGTWVDAILMDIDLGVGRMDGTAAAAEVDRRWGIPVVFYSGHTDRKTIDATRSVTRYGYVQKSPGHERYLVATLEMAVRLWSAERERERAGRRLQALFDAADDNILIHRIAENGLPGQFVDVNNSTCETLGYSRKELLTMSPLDTSYVNRDEEDESARIMANLVRDGRARFEMSGRRRDGTIIPFEIRTQLIEENGEQLVLGISRDMTEHRRNQAALRQSNSLLERFFELRFMNIAILDRSFNYQRVNESYAHSAGRSPEAFIGLNHFALYPDPDNEALFSRVVKTGEPHTERDMPFAFPDQPERGMTYWDVTLFPVFDMQGSVDGVVLIVVETTQRKLETDRSREMTELYRLVTENVSETVAVYDAAMNVRYTSPTSVQQSGWIADELAGTDVFSLVHPEDAPQLEREIADAHRHGLDRHSERYRFRCKDGAWAWMESTTRMIRDQSGSNETIIVTSRRIDREMALTQELKRVLQFLPEQEQVRAKAVLDPS